MLYFDNKNKKYDFSSFTLTIGHPDGYNNINLARMSIRYSEHGTTDLPSDAICFQYNPPDQFQVWDGNRFTPETNPYTFGSSGKIDITNCTIDLSQCNIVKDGETISLTFFIKPKAAFISDPVKNPKQIWCWVRDTPL